VPEGTELNREIFGDNAQQNPLVPSVGGRIYASARITPPVVCHQRPVLTCPTDTQRVKLQMMGLLDRFDPLVISGEIGAAKPDKDAFTPSSSGLRLLCRRDLARWRQFDHRRSGSCRDWFHRSLVKSIWCSRWSGHTSEIRNRQPDGVDRPYEWQRHRLTMAMQRTPESVNTFCLRKSCAAFCCS
jgi:hypothetical protein